MIMNVPSLGALHNVIGRPGPIYLSSKNTLNDLLLAYLHTLVFKNHLGACSPAPVCASLTSDEIFKIIRLNCGPV